MGAGRPTVSKRGDRVRHAVPGGITREEAFSSGGAWVGLMMTAPGEISGWHHHGDHDTYAYVLRGTKTVEIAVGGDETLVAEPGDFVHLPRQLVHRDGSRGAEPVEMVVVRFGTGPTLVEVEGPST